MSWKPGEVRQAASGRRFYVGDRYDPTTDDEYGSRFNATMVNLVEVEGQWTGSKFLVRADVVSRMKLVAQVIE